MSSPRNDLKAALLGQLDTGQDGEMLRAQALASIEAQRRRIKIQHIATQVFWIVCAVVAAAYMWFGPESERVPRAPFLAIFFFLWGGIEILKHRIDRTRVESLAEIKLLQLQFAEWANRSAPR